MNLYSPEFFGFFIIILLLFYLLNAKFQKMLLFLASSAFIASFSLWFLGYTYLFILVNYGLAIFIEDKESNAKLRKLIFNTGIILNISSLLLFKYVNFIIDNLFISFNFINQESSVHLLRLIIPLGISYYTLQGISYLLQVYRGHENPEKDIIIFSNYILLFPKFLAGPIELSKDLIPQLRKTFPFQAANILEGFQLILWGAFKKMVIADRLSMIINSVYSDVDAFSGNPLLVTFLLQPLHLYCDFSGYTDIALGIGRTFGLKLTNNFNRPFFAPSVTNFWKRWHISLSTWCNEFIFKRAAFNKRKWGIWASVYAVFITFLVIGFWHGPKWNFIILGLLQGIAINYEYFTKKYRLLLAAKIPAPVVSLISPILTYLFFCVTLIFFNANTFVDAMHFMKNMFVNLTISKINIIFLTTFDKVIVFFSTLFLLLVEYKQEKGNSLYETFHLGPKWTRTVLYYAMLVLIIYFGSPRKEFIYMQF